MERQINIARLFPLGYSGIESSKIIPVLQIEYDPDSWCITQKSILELLRFEIIPMNSLSSFLQNSEVNCLYPLLCKYVFTKESPRSSGYLSLNFASASPRTLVSSKTFNFGINSTHVVVRGSGSWNFQRFSLSHFSRYGFACSARSIILLYGIILNNFLLVQPRI